MVGTADLRQPHGHVHPLGLVPEEEDRHEANQSRDSLQGQRQDNAGGDND